MQQHNATTHCNALQCNDTMQQHNATTHCNALSCNNTLQQHTATAHCNALQCNNTLQQHNATTHCNALQCNNTIQQHNATAHCNALQCNNTLQQHNATTHCNALHHGRVFKGFFSNSTFHTWNPYIRTYQKHYLLKIFHARKLHVKCVEYTRHGSNGLRYMNETWHKYTWVMHMCVTHMHESCPPPYQNNCTTKCRHANATRVNESYHTD